MVRLEKHGDSAVRFIFTDSDHYLYKDGVVDVPVNSLSLVIDESEMVTFKKASTADPFISFRLDKSNFSSRDELLTFYKENMVGAGGLSEEEVQEMIDAATSGMPSSQVIEQLRTDLNAVSGEVDTKQDILTAGENITISGNVISADAGNNIIELTQAEYDALETKDPEALYIITDAQEINMNDYYTKSEVDASIATKADTSALTAVNNALTAHTANTTVHVTQNEKNTWNGKVDEGYVSDYAYSKNQIDGFLSNAEQVVATKADTSALTVVQDSLSGYVTTTTYESGQYATAQALNALQENKLDASAYTPTDLSQYWTSGQTQEAINAATSGIPSSQVVEQLRTDVNTISGVVQNNISDIADIYDTIDLKEEVIASALTQLNQDVSDIDAKEEVIASALTEVNQALNNKLDASAYTPTDLSEYWTSGQTQNAINAATSGKADTSAVTQSLSAKQDALEYYTEDTSRESATIMVEKYDAAGNVTESRVFVDGGNIFIENYNETDDGGISGTIGAQVDINSLGLFLSAYSEDGENESRTELKVQPMGAYINSEPIATEPYVDAATSGKADTSAVTAVNGALTTHTADTTVHVSQAEKATWNAKADASAITSIESSITAVSNDLNTLSGAVIDNEYTVSQAINELKSTKLDASAYTPTDLSQYWTSAQTQTAINAKQDELTAGSGISISNNVISTSGVVMSQNVTQIVKLTQAAYSALTTKDNQTLYIVVD